MCCSTQAYTTHKFINGSYFLCLWTKLLVTLFDYILFLLLLNCIILAMLNVPKPIGPTHTHTHSLGFLWLLFLSASHIWWCNVMVLPLRAQSITVAFSSYKWHLASNVCALDILHMNDYYYYYYYRPHTICETCCWWELCSTKDETKYDPFIYINFQFVILSVIILVECLPQIISNHNGMLPRK